MPYLQAASGSDDVFIAYVAHYSAGRLLEAAGNVQQAQARYRAALAVAPGVQSASLSLSTLLFTAGQPDEAYEVMRQAFDGPPRPDPFRMYGFGNYRHFDGYVSRLRQALGS
jgi:tetratricopeptide (TPR) repeat protein